MLVSNVRSSALLVVVPAALLLVAASARAAGQDMPTLHSLQPPAFTADLAVAVDSTSRARVKATVSVPYTELTWQRASEGFSAGAAFVVELIPDKGPRRLYGDSWEKRIMVPDYGATTSHRNQMVETREFEVPPGKYGVRVSVRDVRALDESTVSDRLEVRDLSAVPVGFADLELGVVDSAGSFTPYPTREFGFNSGAISVRAVLVDRRAGSWPRQYRYHWRVIDEAGTATAQGDTSLSLQHFAEPVVLHPPHADLFIGDYTFELEMREGKTGWRTTRAFSVEESGPPRGREFDQLLEALAYIADPTEVEGMRGKSADQQAALWEAFWHRRDPTPDTPRNEFQIEFFRRLRYSEQHFLGFGPGWRSDMGRTYIRYGPADQVEQRQATSGQPGLEIWYYNQPYRRLVFADREGFGRFTLLNPQGE